MYPPVVIIKVKRVNERSRFTTKSLPSPNLRPATPPPQREDTTLVLRRLFRHLTLFSGHHWRTKVTWVVVPHVPLLLESIREGNRGPGAHIGKSYRESARRIETGSSNHFSLHHGIDRVSTVILNVSGFLTNLSHTRKTYFTTNLSVVSTVMINNSPGTHDARYVS